MSMRERFVALAVAAIAVAVMTAPATAGPWLLKPGDNYTSLTGGAFATSQFYGQDGDKGPLPGGGQLQERGLVWCSELGWKKQFSFLFAIPVVSATRLVEDWPAGGTQTGLGDMDLGIKWGLMGHKEGTSVVSVQMDVRLPAGYWEEYLIADSTIARLDSTLWKDYSQSDSVNAVRWGSQPKPGQNSTDLQFTLQYGLEIPALRGFLQAEGGYRLRFGDWSNQSLLRADLGFWLSRHVLLSGAYGGDYPGGDTDYEAESMGMQVAAGQLLYRINDVWDVYAGGAWTIAATNYPAENRVYAGLAFKKSNLNRLQGFLGTLKQP